jgi:SET domain-containing protein
LLTMNKVLGIINHRDDFPHIGVYARLAPSKLHGVGVFAIRNIRKGIEIFPGVDDKIVWVDPAKIKNLPAAIRRLYEDFGIYKDGKIGCPTNFNLLNASCYINHSDLPNLRLDNNYRAYAARNIKKGEELTLDYTTYMDQNAPSIGRSKS